MFIFLVTWFDYLLVEIAFVINRCFHDLPITELNKGLLCGLPKQGTIKFVKLNFYVRDKSVLLLFLRGLDSLRSYKETYRI